MKLGNIATGDDFFDRSRIRDDIWRYLADNHLVLRGPRRLGKSSVLQRLTEEADEKGLLCVMSDIGGLSIAGFIGSLDKSLPDSRVKAYLSGISAAATAWMGRIKEVKLSALGVEGEIRFQDSEAPHWYQDAKKLEQRLSSVPVVIQLDEFSVFLEKAIKDNRPEAEYFLWWLRSWRNQKDVCCRFIYTGSIGVNYLLERHQLDTYMNDCHELTLGPFLRKDAKAMIVELAGREQWRISQSVVDALCQRAGWLSPFLVNLLLDKTMEAARDRIEEIDRIDGADQQKRLTLPDLEDGYERLIAHRSRFTYWEQRLERDLREPLLSISKDILTAIARSKRGLSLRQISNRLAKRAPKSDRRQSQMHRSLNKLYDEGYLSTPGKTGRIDYLSYLLKEYWKRNHV